MCACLCVYMCTVIQMANKSYTCKLINKKKIKSSSIKWAAINDTKINNYTLKSQKMNTSHMSLCKSDLGEVYGIHNAKSFIDTVKSKLCSQENKKINKYGKLYK